MGTRPVIRIYHVTHPTAEHLIGFKAPRWPDAHNLAACFPDPGLAPKEALELAFTCTQQDHPLIDTVSWQPGALDSGRCVAPGEVSAPEECRSLSHQRNAEVMEGEKLLGDIDMLTC
jgi:hypothetical protein